MVQAGQARSGTTLTVLACLDTENARWAVANVGDSRVYLRPVGEPGALLERSGLEVRDGPSLREHYVWTVYAWLASIESRWAEAVALVGVEMARAWRLYLVGSRLSFEQGRMGVDQILAVRPRPDGRSALPAVRLGLTSTAPDAETPRAEASA